METTVFFSQIFYKKKHVSTRHYLPKFGNRKHPPLSLSLSNSKLKLYIPFQSCRDRKKDGNSKTMKAFLGLSVLILLLAEEALCSSREQRLSKLLEKVEARVASSPTGRLLAPPPREAVDNHTWVKENYSHIFIILCLLITLFVILIFLFNVLVWMCYRMGGYFIRLGMEQTQVGHETVVMPYCRLWVML